MNEYCGKNGCYEIEEGEHFDGEYLYIYLNSPVVYIYHGERSVRVIGGERPEPDVTFELFCADGEMLTGRMEVESLFSEGVAEFVSELAGRRDEIGDKDGLIAVLERLLDQEGAVWGVVQPDPEQLTPETLHS